MAPVRGRPPAEVAQNRVKKGIRLTLMGRLKTLSFVKDDVTHHRTEAVVDELEFHGATLTDGEPEAEDVDGPVEPTYEMEVASEEDIPY